MTESVKVRLEPLGRTIEARKGSALQDILFRYGVEFPCGGHGTCRTCRIRVLAGGLPAGLQEEAVLTKDEILTGWRLSCQHRATGDLVLEVGQWEPVILADSATLEVAPAEGFGIAVDVGTTTLVAQLVDRTSGTVVGVSSGLNPQATYGSDLMSRLQYALDDAGRIRLTVAIREAVGQLVDELIQSLPSRPSIHRIALVGNTVMHHLFCGIDPAPLAHVPFEPAETGSCFLKAETLGWSCRTEIVFLPCIGSFVGSDLLAGLLATAIHESRELAALVDLGTNGEVAVGNREMIVCSSTAAGPAFEGARVRMGMQAATGAVDRVELRGGQVRVHVIGGGAARGICGSGLVDAVAAALDLGVVEPGGRLKGGAREWVVAPPVSLFQSDVRELQLANAAISAALLILTKRREAGPGHLSKVFLAGAFGNYVSRESARRIGMIDHPPVPVEPAGNAALRGARMALFPEGLEAIQALRVKTHHVALAAAPDFQEAFVAAMAFPTS